LDIPDNTWEAEKAAVFDFMIKDSSQVFNLFIEIGNTNDYRYSNLWLLVKTSVKEGDIAYDTLEYFLADERGKWLGAKNGNVFLNNFVYKNGVRFPRQGKYSVEIIQLMRDEKLKGINKVGFKIENLK
jgi:gliding motility-associated lipoprotein GldH